MVILKRPITEVWQSTKSDNMLSAKDYTLMPLRGNAHVQYEYAKILKYAKIARSKLNLK